MSKFSYRFGVFLLPLITLVACQPGPDHIVQCLGEAQVIAGSPSFDNQGVIIR